MAGRRDPALPGGLFGVPMTAPPRSVPAPASAASGDREVSSGLETYCPQLDLDLEDLAFARSWARLAIPLAPGSVVPPWARPPRRCCPRAEALDAGRRALDKAAARSEQVAARHPDIVLVHSMAHADLRHSWLGLSHSHACAMRTYAMEVLPSGQLLQIAIRSGTRAEFRRLRHSGRLVGHRPRPLLMSRGVCRPTWWQPWRPWRGKPLYLTMDLRLVRPSVSAGTAHRTRRLSLGHTIQRAEWTNSAPPPGGGAGCSGSSHPCSTPGGQQTPFWRRKWFAGLDASCSVAPLSNSKSARPACSRPGARAVLAIRVNREGGMVVQQVQKMQPASFNQFSTGVRAIASWRKLAPTPTIARDS